MLELSSDPVPVAGSADVELDPGSLDVGPPLGPPPEVSAADGSSPVELESDEEVGSLGHPRASHVEARSTILVVLRTVISEYMGSCLNGLKPFFGPEFHGTPSAPEARPARAP